MRGSERGSSLVEVLVAFVLLTFGVLAAAPMFIHGTRMAAASADVGTAGAAATKRMELLRATSFGSLVAGGSLVSDLVSYSDLSDPAVRVRWTIANDASPATAKTITVIAISRRVVSGPAKRVKLTTMRSR
jgi:Tfp pilus assembly protein PilV